MDYKKLAATRANLNRLIEETAYYKVHHIPFSYSDEKAAIYKNLKNHQYPEHIIHKIMSKDKFTDKQTPILQPHQLRSIDWAKQDPTKKSSKY